jgi:uncharacterized protein YyaL (SSP411 family)
MSEVTLPSPEVIENLPPDGGPDYNRLIHERSPYLLQHAANAVDWYPWGNGAFAKARAEDKPIFLSIGYSTCHWCHVMERESFENARIAALLNENFIPVKVDREERPDIDEIYMKATQLVTGGGWPNSVWLTPEGRPWFAGTYFPPEDVSGRSGFRTVLLSLTEYWQTRRQEVETQAEQIMAAMERMSSAESFIGTGKLSSLLIERSIESLRESFDSGWGGFGSAPKFPPHGSLNLIFDQYRRTGDQSDLGMALETLRRMAAGGIHDHLGGGFHRYSTDARWLAPHFEKMLYDNAQLGRAYVDASLISGDEEFRSAAAGIYDWILREMTDSEGGGGFYSAIDADSEGEEGKFYVWRLPEVISVLGEEEGDLFCQVYNVLAEGNFRDEATGSVVGTNIIHLEKPIAEIAVDIGLEQTDLHRRLEKSRQKLLERRDKRVRPQIDDKVLAAWNGLMIGSLAYGGRKLDEPRYTAAAGKAADFILSEMYRDGRLLRSYREGRAGLNAYLDDYAFLIHGLLELYKGDGDETRLRSARDLMEVLIENYLDPAEGGFYFTSADHEELLLRSKDPFDRAIPSGNGLAASALVRLADLTGESRYLDLAGETLRTFQGTMEAAPRGTESLLLAVSAYLEARAKSAERPVIDVKPLAEIYRKPLTVEVFAVRDVHLPGERFNLTVSLSLEDDWHVNSHNPFQDNLTPTSVEIGGGDILTPGKAVYPEGSRVTFEFSPEPMSVYREGREIVIPVTVSEKAATGITEMELTVNYQACNDYRCLAPEVLTLTVPITVSP